MGVGGLVRFGRKQRRFFCKVFGLFSKKFYMGFSLRTGVCVQSVGFVVNPV